VTVDVKQNVFSLQWNGKIIARNLLFSLINLNNDIFFDVSRVLLKKQGKGKVISVTGREGP
jgi:hypothetical protein